MLETMQSSSCPSASSSWWRPSPPMPPSDTRLDLRLTADDADLSDGDWELIRADGGTDSPPVSPTTTTLTHAMPATSASTARAITQWLLSLLAIATQSWRALTAALLFVAGVLAQCLPVVLVLPSQRPPSEPALLLLLPSPSLLPGLGVALVLQLAALLAFALSVVCIVPSSRLLTARSMLSVHRLLPMALYGVALLGVLYQHTLHTPLSVSSMLPFCALQLVCVSYFIQHTIFTAQSTGALARWFPGIGNRK